MNCPIGLNLGELREDFACRGKDSRDHIETEDVCRGCLHYRVNLQFNLVYRRVYRGGPVTRSEPLIAETGWPGEHITAGEAAGIGIDFRP